MLELKPIADIGQDIKNYISSRRKKSKVDDQRDCDSLRLINQEKDGSILYTWEDSPAEEDNLRTYIGIFCPDTKDHRVVWVFDQVEYVSSCSINQHHTLLAFTVLTNRSNGSEGQKFYTAYLAEILTPNRLFSLNIERVNFLKVQFLHLTAELGQGNDFLDREAYMLVFLHRESIGLYHIPLARAGEDAMIMKRQPEKEQLTGEFLWSSWDVHNQRLHYIYHQHDEDINYRNFHTILSTLQFSRNGKYDSMIDVPLNFPIPFVSKTSSPVYIDIPLCSVIPDRSLNVEVLTLSNGTFCVCYQPTLSLEKPTPQTRHATSKNSDLEDDDSVDVVYFVCLVHHVHTLQGTVSRIPLQEATRRRIFFTWFNGYLVVSLPGFFTHLLNASVEYEPCNHILLHKESLQGSVSRAKKPGFGNPPGEADTTFETKEMTTCSKDEGRSSYQSILHPTSKRLQLMNHFCKGMYISGWTVYDKKNQRLYKLVANKEQLVHLFSSCFLSTTRMALFHYALLHDRDYNVIKKIFVALSNDCASPEVQEIMSEFLVSTTYLNMRRRVSKNILLMVPFTTSETFRGQFEKNQAKEILSKIQYHVLSSIKIGKKTAKERLGRLHFEDLWDTLRQHLRQNQTSQLQFPRFSTNEIIQQKASLLLNAKNLEDFKLIDGNTFLSKLCQNQSCRDISSSESETDTYRAYYPDPVLGSMPNFLKSTQLTKEYGMLMLLVKDTFTEFLIKFLKTEPQVKLENIAKEFVASQLHQARQLCQFAWSITRPNENVSLTVRATQDVFELFQLFERISMALKEQMFPITDGFCTYLTTLAFRCLHESQFLHYVDSGAVLLTDNFIRLVMRCLDGDKYTSLKYQIITRLPEKSALLCCQNWTHPYSTTFFTTQSIKEMLLSTDWVMTAEEHLGSTSGGDQFIPQSFYPLTAFMAYLNEKNEPNSRKSVELPGNRRLQDAALCHTSHETDCNLSNVNF